MSVWSKGSPENVFDRERIDKFWGALDWHYFKSKYGCSRKWWRSRINALRNIICDGGIFNERKKSGSAGGVNKDEATITTKAERMGKA